MADNDAPASPTFQLNKFYLKDASFESPASPKVFGGQNSSQNPQIEVQLTISHERVPDTTDIHEVVLDGTCTAKTGEQTVFIAEVQQAGIFTISGYTQEQLEKMLEAACPNVLFPFLRETVAALVAKGGFPQLLLSPVNFEMMYQQKKDSRRTNAEELTHEQGSV